MHSINILEDRGIIEVVTTGDLMLAEMEQERSKAGKIAKETGILRILVDDRGVTSVPSSVELYQFGATFWQSDLPPNVVVAHVVSPDVITEMEFLENVAVNRGTLVKTFIDIDKAFEWLEQQ